MQKIIPNLWFDSQAEEAANFYVSVFKNSKIGTVARYDKQGAAVAGRPEGSVMTISFTLDGNEFVGINGGPVFTLSEAVSFMIVCKDQAEIDYFWEKLTDGGSEQPCGWLKDRFGLSWQVVPDGFDAMMRSGTPEQISRAMGAMFKMKKIVIADLEAAMRG